MGKKKDKSVGHTAGTYGITLGTCLAVTISWHAHQSILWAIIHGLFSWFYVIYYALTR